MLLSVPLSRYIRADSTFHVPISVVHITQQCILSTLLASFSSPCSHGSRHSLVCAARGWHRKSYLARPERYKLHELRRLASHCHCRQYMDQYSIFHRATNKYTYNTDLNRKTIKYQYRHDHASNKGKLTRGNGTMTLSHSDRSSAQIDILIGTRNIRSISKMQGLLRHRASMGTGVRMLFFPLAKVEQETGSHETG